MNMRKNSQIIINNKVTKFLLLLFLSSIQPESSMKNIIFVSVQHCPVVVCGAFIFQPILINSMFPLKLSLCTNILNFYFKCQLIGFYYLIFPMKYLANVFQTDLTYKIIVSMIKGVK